MNNDYEVREDGTIYSYKSGKTLKGRESSNGYLCVAVSINKKPKQYMIHNLVAKKYLGVKPVGCIVDHKDGNNYNNAVDNLRYITQSDNIKKGKEKVYIGREKAIRIRNMIPNMRNRRRLAKLYNVSLQTIMNIVNNKNYM